VTDADTTRIAERRRELRLAIAELEAACWALEKYAAQVPGATDALIRIALLAASMHMERAK